MKNRFRAASGAIAGIWLSRRWLGGISTDPDLSPYGAA